MTVKQFALNIKLSCLRSDSAVYLYFIRWGIYRAVDVRYLSKGGSVAEWLACWTQAQKGPGSNRSRDAVG